MVFGRNGVHNSGCNSYDGFVTFEVMDTGVGIAADNLERIFDPFFTTRDEGTGMGLSIVEQLTSLHGGDVQVTSTLGEGTMFTVNWPSRRPSARGSVVLDPRR